MSTPRLAWLTSALLAVAALALGYYARMAPAEATITVEWATASELDTAGFNLYRSESPDGPFTRINDYLIPGSLEPLIGGSYVFTDTDVVAGHTYYYQLEDVETVGTTTRHEPVQVKAEPAGRTQMLLAAALTGVTAFGVGIVGLNGFRRSPSQS